MAYVEIVAIDCDASGVCLSPAQVEVFTAAGVSLGRFCVRHGHTRLQEANRQEAENATLDAEDLAARGLLASTGGAVG